MPTRAPRACGHSGCGGIQGRCPLHDAQRAARKQRHRPDRPTAAQRGYDAPWRRLVALAKRLQLATYGVNFCVDCGINDARARATDNPLSGDHKRWPALTVDDVDIVCRRCNSRRGGLRTGVSG